MEKYKVLKEFTVGENTFPVDSIILGEIIGTPEEIMASLEGGFVELFEAPVEYDGSIGQYKIIGKAPYTDEHGTQSGFLEIGSVQELPIPVGDVFVEQGVAEKVEVTGTQPDSSIAAAEVTSTDGEVKEQVIIFEGKQVISDTIREINGKEYHTIRLSDGSSQDLTQEEYELKIASQIK